jgi:hypothetical protein
MNGRKTAKSLKGLADRYGEIAENLAAIAISPLSGDLRPAQNRTNAALFGDCGERRIITRLVGGANRI